MDYLFDKWDRITAKLKGKCIFIFLDFDGTLAPIVDTPKEAFLSDETKGLLKRMLSNPRFKLAIISGRALKDIKERVGLKNIIYVGNHGLEIEGPKIKFENPMSPRSRAVLEHIKSDLAKRLSGIKGVILEDKGFSLSIHYRLADKSLTSKVKTIIHEAVIFYLVRDKIKIKSGKMVLEIRLPSGWDKGRVVLWLLSREKFMRSNSEVMPIYIGDDTTDEDAFKALKDVGITIFVGRPKQSYARYYTKDTNEVGRFLKIILEMQGDKS